MKNFFIYLIIVLFFSQQLAQSQEIKDKNVLIVWGGWEGHTPWLCGSHRRIELYVKY